MKYFTYLIPIFLVLPLYAFEKVHTPETISTFQNLSEKTPTNQIPEVELRIFLQSNVLFNGGGLTVVYRTPNSYGAELGADIFGSPFFGLVVQCSGSAVWFINESNSLSIGLGPFASQYGIQKVSSTASALGRTVGAVLPISYCRETDLSLFWRFGLNCYAFSWKMDKFFNGIPTENKRFVFLPLPFLQVGRTF